MTLLLLILPIDIVLGHRENYFEEQYRKENAQSNVLNKMLLLKFGSTRVYGKNLKNVSRAISRTVLISINLRTSGHVMVVE